MTSQLKPKIQNFLELSISRRELHSIFVGKGKGERVRDNSEASRQFRSRNRQIQESKNEVEVPSKSMWQLER